MLADTLVRAYLKQIVIDGVFHADPHPGNVLVTDDGLLALVDLGMIGRLSPQMQERLLRLLLAVSEGRGEEAADVAVTLGEKLPDFNESGFRRAVGVLVGRVGHQSIAEFQIGKVFLELSQLIHDNHMRAPAELTMLGKTLLNVDEVARALDPKLDVNEAVRRNGADLMTQRMRKAATSGSMISTLLEAKEFAEKLPGRVNRVLDALAASELKMKVEVIDDGAIIDGLQKVANRITLGLILAAMIVGAAMIMRIETASGSSATRVRDDAAHAGVCRRGLSGRSRSFVTTERATHGDAAAHRIPRSRPGVPYQQPQRRRPQLPAAGRCPPTQAERRRHRLDARPPADLVVVAVGDPLHVLRRSTQLVGGLRDRALVRGVLAVDAGGVPAAVRSGSQPDGRHRRSTSTPCRGRRACRSCRRQHGGPAEQRRSVLPGDARGD